MVDVFSPQKRSSIMAAIKGKNTKPELVVRRLVWGLGFRYRLHGRNLPGRPDLVFPGRRKVIFVHGCFWHRHDGCRLAYKPSTRAEFWQEKFDLNRQRDLDAVNALEDLGWTVLIIWECQTRRDIKLLEAMVMEFIEK
nr:very short patch repair endonuclease [Magnetospirillum sp. XM-1]